MEERPLPLYLVALYHYLQALDRILTLLMMMAEVYFP